MGLFDDLTSDLEAPRVSSSAGLFDDLTSDLDNTSSSFRPWAYSGSIQDTAVPERSLYSIASESDKAARAEADYLWENKEKIVKPVPAMAAANVVQGVGGKVRQAGDLLGIDSLSTWGDEFAESGKTVSDYIQKEEDLEQGSWANSIRNALSSIYQQAPGMVAGGSLYRAGKGALGLATSLAPMGAMTGGESYQKLRERGFDPATATAGAAVDEIAEVGTELLPQMFMFKAVVPNGKDILKPFIANIIKSDLSEFAGEALATTIQDVNNSFLSDPNLTPDERVQKVKDYYGKVNPQTGNVPAWDNFLETMRSTAAQTLLQTGGGAMVRTGIDAVADRQSDPLTSGMGFDPSAQSTAALMETLPSNLRDKTLARIEEMRRKQTETVSPDILEAKTGDDAVKAFVDEVSRPTEAEDDLEIKANEDLLKELMGEETPPAPQQQLADIEAKLAGITDTAERDAYMASLEEPLRQMLEGKPTGVPSMQNVDPVLTVTAKNDDVTQKNDDVTTPVAPARPAPAGRFTPEILSQLDDDLARISDPAARDEYEREFYRAVLTGQPMTQGMPEQTTESSPDLGPVNRGTAFDPHAKKAAGIDTAILEKEHADKIAASQAKVDAAQAEVARLEGVKSVPLHQMGAHQQELDTARQKLTVEEQRHAGVMETAPGELDDARAWNDYIQAKFSLGSQGGATIHTTTGHPYQREDTARRQLEAKNLQATHEVVPVAGGYAISPRNTGSQGIPTPTPTSEMPSESKFGSEADKAAQGAGSQEVVPKLSIAGRPDITHGININDTHQPFTTQILDGQKTIETRDTNSLGSYVGKTVGLVSTTRNGKAQVVGYATVGAPKVYSNESEFRADEESHRVAQGSPYDIKPGGVKYGYPLTNVTRIAPQAPAGTGIVARKLSIAAPRDILSTLSDQEVLDRDVNGQLSLGTNPDGTVKKATAAKPTTQQYRASKLFKDLFGVRVIFADGIDGAVNGMWVGDGTIVVNSKTVAATTNAEDHYMWVFGHEVAHELKSRDAAAWNSLVKAMTPYLKGIPEHRARLNEQASRLGFQYSEEAAMEELVADVFGDLIMDGKFWAHLSKENKTVAQKLLDIVRAMIDHISAKFQGKQVTGKAAEFVTDLEKIMEVAAKYVSERVDAGGQSGVAEESKYAAAWHGSPHDHDKFSTEKIGTGEGAQAYGYGLYFAEDRGIAEWYRRRLSGNTTAGSAVGKQLYQKDKSLYDAVKQVLVKRGHRVDQYLISHVGNSVFVTLDSLMEDNSRYTFGDELYERMHTFAKAEIKESGRLYQVELAPAEDEYLLWDKPLSEQSEKVKNNLGMGSRPASDIQRDIDALNSKVSQVNSARRESSRDWEDYLFSEPSVSYSSEINALEKELASARRNAWISENLDLHGSRFYKTLADQHGNDKAASEYLHSLGIRGIKYLDGTSRSGKKENYNYVIFNDSDVEIKAKFSLKEVATALNAHGGTLAPSYSIRTWTDDEKAAVLTVAQQQGIPESKAKKWLADIDNAMERVLRDPTLDFDAAASDLYSALKDNSDKHYKKSLDFSTLCRKRYELIATIEAIQVKTGRAVEKDTWVAIRQILDEMGYDVSCGACYVDAKRMETGKFINQFIDSHPEEDPSQFLSQAGIDQLKRSKPKLYDAFMERLRSNNSKTPESRTDYKGEIREYFIESSAGKERVEEMNKRSGLRWQSWSDFEFVHLLDAMQAILDMQLAGLRGHAYTKVPDFVRALGRTGLMINMSLIPKGTGLNANGELVFDSKEGMDFQTAIQLRDDFEKTAGTIAIGVSNEHIKALLDDPRIDYVIPYHASGLAGDIAKKFNMDGWVDYTDNQTEDIDDIEVFHKWMATQFPLGRIKNKDGSFVPSTRLKLIEAKKSGNLSQYRDIAKKAGLVTIPFTEYWSDLRSGRANADKYLALCKERGIAPKFRLYEYAKTKTTKKYGKVREVYKFLADFTQDPNYWKLLIDRKSYDHKGRNIVQKTVQPVYDMDEIHKIYDEASGNPIPDRAVEEVVQQFTGRNAKLSLRGESKEDRSGLGSDTITVMPSGKLPARQAELLQSIGRTPMEVQGETSDMLRAIAKTFNQRIVFYRADHQSAGANGVTYSPDGFMSPDDGRTLYLNVAASRHLNAVIGHEIAHSLELNDEVAYKKLLKDLLPHINDPKLTQYIDELKKNPTYAEADLLGGYKEAVSDAMGDLFTNKGFWNTLATEKPTLFRQLADVTLKVLNKLTHIFKGPKVSDLFTDYASANRILVDAVKTYAETQGQDALTSEMKLSLREPPSGGNVKYSLPNAIDVDGVQRPTEGQLIHIGTDKEGNDLYQLGDEDFYFIRDTDMGFQIVNKNQFTKSGYVEAGVREKYYPTIEESAGQLLLWLGKKNAPVKIVTAISPRKELKPAADDRLDMPIDIVLGKERYNEADDYYEWDVTVDGKPVGYFREVDWQDQKYEFVSIDGLATTYRIKDNSGWEKSLKDFIRDKFSPTQVKSATGNTGAFSAENPDVRYSLTSPFTSKLADTVAQKMGGKMFVGQLRAMLRNNGVSQDEIANILGEFDEGKSVTKQEVQDAIKANSVELQDVVLGDEMTRKQVNRYEQLADKELASGLTEDESIELEQLQKIADVEKTHFSQYTEPGAVDGSYREMFVTVPEKAFQPPISYEQWLEKEITPKYRTEANDATNRKLYHNDMMVIAREQQEKSIWWDGHSQYSSIQNPIVRIRFNERNADGKRILFVEEVQGPSDANQQKMPEYLRKRIYDIGVKRILSYAKKQGYDGVSWTSGAMQAARYDLSKQVDSISWQDGILADKRVEINTPDGNGETFKVNDEGIITSGSSSFRGRHIDEVVGKEIGRQIVSERQGNLSGLDLKVGGEGLSSLYDRTLPAMFKKYGKGEVETTGIFVGEKANRNLGDPTLEDMRQYARDEYQVSYDNLTEAQQDEIYEELAEKMQTEAAKTVSVPFLPISDATPSVYPMYSLRGDLPRGRFTSISPEVQQRRDAAHGLEKGPGLLDRIKELIHQAKKETQHFPELDMKRDAQTADILRVFEASRSASTTKAVAYLKKLTGDFTPEEMNNFEWRVLLDDLKGELDKGNALPFGYTPDTLTADYDRIVAITDGDAKIRRALDYRKERQRELVGKLVEKGLLPESVMENENYFRHMVLEYANAKKWAGLSNSQVRNKKRGWMKGREGSEKDINTNFLEAEFEVYSQQLQELATKEALEKVEKINSITGRLKGQAKRKNFENLVGGPENVSRIRELEGRAAEIRGDGTELDSADRQMLRSIYEELDELDPTRPFKKKMAKSFAKLARLAEEGRLPAGQRPSTRDMAEAIAAGEPNDKLFNYIAELAGHADDDVAIPARTLMKTIADLDKMYRETLGKEYLEHRRQVDSRLIPEGYVEWQPVEGNLFVKQTTLPESVVDRAIREMWSIEDLQNSGLLKPGVILAGKKRSIVIPEGVALTLDNLRFDREAAVLDTINKKVLGGWKIWTLLSPRRVLKYNLNNMSGDLDVALAADPKILTYMKQAWDAALKRRKGELSDTDEDMLDRGVLDSGISINEIPDISELPLFRNLTDDQRNAKIWDVLKGGDFSILAPNTVIAKYFDKIQRLTNIREGLLREAAYRRALELLQQGKPVMWASKPGELNAIPDIKDKAAKLSRELVGDYGNLSAHGEKIRARIVPFWSWMEINAPRYYRIFKNAAENGGAYSTGARVVGVAGKKFIGTSAGVLEKVILTQMLFALVSAFNFLVHGDDEEELDIKQLHLILGKDSAGKILSVRFQGAFSDALSWFGLEDYPSIIKKMNDGSMDAHDLAAKMAMAIPNKMANAAFPYVKLAGETVMGKTIYPEVGKPRVIRDRTEHVARFLSLDNEYRVVAGKPSRGYAESLRGAVVYASDPREAAYNEIISLAYKYRGEHDKGYGGTGEPSERANALYYYKQSLRFGDQEAAQKYLAKYKELGGRNLEVSIANAAPLKAVGGKYLHGFKETLTATEKQKLKLAEEYYKDTFIKQRRAFQ